jgi:NADPH-dependent F420 reductase
MTGPVRGEIAVSDIAIIGGTGHQGYGLALRWALAGKHIAIGSRDATRAAAAAANIGESLRAVGAVVPVVEGLDNQAAAARAPVVVLTVPLAAQIATMKAIRESIRPGAILIDVTVPLATAIGGRASRVLGLPAGSAAEQVAELAPPGVQVMSAFHFLAADLLAEVTAGGATPMDCDVVACGGDPQAQAVLRELTEAISGTRYIHGGTLAASRLVESTAALLIAINIRNKTRHAGLRVTGLGV